VDCVQAETKVRAKRSSGSVTLRSPPHCTISIGWDASSASSNATGRPNEMAELRKCAGMRAVWWPLETPPKPVAIVHSDDTTMDTVRCAALGWPADSSSINVLLENPRQ